MSASHNLFRIPDIHRARRATGPRHMRSEELSRRLDELKDLIEERDQLREQLDHVRDFADRMMVRADEQATQIVALQAQLAAKDALIADLEAENRVLIGQVSAREDRISLLENFLKMIADAEDRSPSA